MRISSRSGSISIALFCTGLDLLVTIVTMRGPGLTWRRLPIFCWAVLGTSLLMVFATPLLTAPVVMALLDRTVGTGFFVPGVGGSPYLWENLFWYFGHPEVYIMAIPAMGLVLEIIPVFARKRLWGYRLAVVGLLGIALLSFLVWQHHLFNSGINADVRPFYSLSTELVSFPTGFIWLVALGTIWRSRHAVQLADVVLAGVLLQLPGRRDLGGVPRRRREQRDDARVLLRPGALPLHDHGRAGVRDLRGDLLLDAR